MSRTSKKSRRKNKSKNTDIRGIIYIAVGILLSVAIYTDLIGALSKISQRLSHFLIGIGSYITNIFVVFRI